MENSCNTCPYAECVRVKTNMLHTYNNWYCNKDNKKMILDISIVNGSKIRIPNWCPLKDSKMIVGSTNKECETGKIQKKYLTYYEKMELLRKLPPQVKWENIKKDDIYHVPPYLDEKRKDIIITSKSDYSCTYKILAQNPKDSNGISYTLYKTTLMSRFIVPHKIKTIEVVNH